MLRVTADIEWLLVLVQVPAQPSRHRVSVWRQLRKTGAVPVSPGLWTVPAGPAFEPGIERARELCREGNGTFAVVGAAPRDAASAALFRNLFRDARAEEWAEFIADCGKFEAEIAKEIAKEKFTFAELEEEEQSLDRLRRWHRELKKRDVLELSEAHDADRRLRACAGVLAGFAEQVYRTVHGLSGDADDAVAEGAGPATLAGGVAQ
jgi:hypothetical protein